MSSNIRSLLSAIKNPVSGATLESENRIETVEVQGDKLIVQYQRDGISPADKRQIETAIYEAVSAQFPMSNVIVKTSSTASQDVYKAVEGKKEAAPAQNEQPAQLKTGHGTVGNKRSIEGVSKIIAIGSGKGGVGKSTFTANLAVTLALQGKKVGVIDADIYGPSLPMLFGKRNEKPRSNGEKKILPVEAFGVKFMSFGLFIAEGDPVIWRGPMLGGVLNQFLFDVTWGELDYLLIDLPPGTGDIQLSMIQNANVDGAIIISTPQDVALLDATKGLEMFKKLNLPIIGMVENMSSFICTNCNHEHFIFGHGGVEEAVKKLDVNFLGGIPLELELRKSADAGVPYMSNPQNAGRAVFESYQAVAEKVHGFFYSPTDSGPSKGGVISKLFGFMNK